MIKIENIKKTISKRKILNGINLICEKGKIQALLGANGAGKTTLINIISGLSKSTKGCFYINDEKIDLDNYTYRKNVGYVFENPLYFEKLTAKEYLTFVAEMYELTKDSSINRVEELILFFELPRESSKKIESYSKGMKKKVSIAASLIHNPSYLILDEPFDGLDFVSIEKTKRLLRKISDHGTTILITSHQFDIVSSISDNFALLINGEILFNLNMEELQKKANVKQKKTLASVKKYLESLMTNSQTENLSWL